MRKTMTTWRWTTTTTATLTEQYPSTRRPSPSLSLPPPSATRLVHPGRLGHLACGEQALPGHPAPLWLPCPCSSGPYPADPWSPGPWSPGPWSPALWGAPGRLERRVCGSGAVGVGVVGGEVVVGCGEDCDSGLRCHIIGVRACMYIWLVVRAVIVGVTAHACCVLGGAQPVKNVPVGMLAGMLIKSSQARVTLIEGCWMVRRRPRRSSCSREVAYIDIRIRAVQLCCRGVRACVVAWHAARGWRMHIYMYAPAWRRPWSNI